MNKMLERKRNSKTTLSKSSAISKSELECRKQAVGLTPSPRI